MKASILPRYAGSLPINLAGLVIIFILMSACLPAPAPIATPTASQTASLPAHTPTPTLKPFTPTPTPTPLLPYHWPIPPLTNAQIAEVKNCDIEHTAHERYDDKSPLGPMLASVFAPQSACDWAILAFAYLDRSDRQLATDALSRAAAENPGFVLANSLFEEFFGSISLAEPPPFAQHEVTDVKIRYVWGGITYETFYNIDIHNANSIPVIDARPYQIAASMNPNANKELIQALGSAMGDLVPIQSTFYYPSCINEGTPPIWEVTLTFADHTTVTMRTFSDFPFFGGPWSTKIDGQFYVQDSPTFSNALGELSLSLDLPSGGPSGKPSPCPGQWDPPPDNFGSAFPESSEEYSTPTGIPVSTATAKPHRLPLSTRLSGIFALRENSLPRLAIMDREFMTLELFRFYSDGDVFYSVPASDFHFFYDDWFLYLRNLNLYSDMGRDSGIYPSICKGKYHLAHNQITFSLSCDDPRFYSSDRASSPLIIDFTGVYTGDKLILDSFSHFNGYANKGRVFLPIEDPSLEP